MTGSVHRPSRIRDKAAEATALIVGTSSWAGNLSEGRDWQSSMAHGSCLLCRHGGGDAGALPYQRDRNHHRSGDQNSGRNQQPLTVTSPPGRLGTSAKGWGKRGRRPNGFRPVLGRGRAAAGPDRSWRQPPFRHVLGPQPCQSPRRGGSNSGRAAAKQVCCLLIGEVLVEPLHLRAKSQEPQVSLG